MRCQGILVGPPRSAPATCPLVGLTKCTRLQAMHVIVSYVLVSSGTGARTNPCTLCPVVGHRNRNVYIPHPPIHADIQDCSQFTTTGVYLGQLYALPSPLPTSG